MQAGASKKKVKKTNVPVSEVVYGTLASSDLQKAIEKEFEMALQDRVMEETKDKKNAVEAYVYDMRNKVEHCPFLKNLITSYYNLFLLKKNEFVNIILVILGSVHPSNVAFYSFVFFVIYAGS